MKVKADRELFERFRDLGDEVQSAGALVQNNVEMDENEALVLIAQANRLVSKLQKLVDDTRTHVMDGK